MSRRMVSWRGVGGCRHGVHGEMEVVRVGFAGSIFLVWLGRRREARWWLLLKEAGSERSLFRSSCLVC